MERPTRESIFAQAAEKLRVEFQGLRSVPHSGLKGQEGEGIVRKFLNDHLPKRFAVGSGFIIDKNDHVSRQADLVVYDALNCPLYRVSDHASIIPNDHVAALIEVKSRLDKKDLEDAAKKIFEAKSLEKTLPPATPALVQFETIGIVFAFDSPLNLETVADHYREIIVEQGGLRRHIDFIFVLGKGMIGLSGKPRGADGWAPALIMGTGGNAGEGAHIAVGSQVMGEKTLDAFLRTLLAHLTFFRHGISHPGFNWSPEKGAGPARLDYLTSVTLEKDPEKKKKILEKYKKEVEDEFRRSSLPEKPGGQ